MKSKQNQLIFKIKSSWWVVLFIGICLFSYKRSIQKKSAEIDLLEKKLSLLHKEETQLVSQKQDLLQQIASQKDPEWIELVLMKKLGVVPRGQVKIYFKKEKG